MGTMLAINGNVINSQEPLPIPVDFMTKLWENPNPTADFEQQQITLSENATNYEFLMIELKYMKNADYRYNVIGHTGNNIILSYGECGSQGARITQRNLYLVSGYSNKLRINDCEMATGSTASTTANDHCIPLAIYGFNTKVPMQDGGASRGSAMINADGVKTYAQLMTDLYNMLDHSLINENTVFVMTGTDNVKSYGHLGYNSYDYSVKKYTFVVINGSASALSANAFSIAEDSANSGRFNTSITASGNTLTNASNAVPGVGYSFKIIY